MPTPAMGRPALPELAGAAPLERARFVARQRAAGLRFDQIGALLGVSPQRAGQLLRCYSHDPEIAALKDVGSAIRLHRQGIAALAELVELGLAVAREAASNPDVERREKASIIAAAVGPAHRLVEGSEKVLRRHQIGVIEKERSRFDKDKFLDAIAQSLEKIEQLPPADRPSARQVLREAIHGSNDASPAVDVEAVSLVDSEK